jgi:hypothetical protein
MRFMKPIVLVVGVWLIACVTVEACREIGARWITTELSHRQQGYDQQVQESINFIQSLNAKHAPTLEQNALDK